MKLNQSFSKHLPENAKYATVKTIYPGLITFEVSDKLFEEQETKSIISMGKEVKGKWILGNNLNNRNLGLIAFTVEKGSLKIT